MTPILDDWRQSNLMSIPTQMCEVCRIFGLQMVSANGIISFTCGDGSPLANEVVGKVFNYNFEEILQQEKVIQTEIPQTVNIVTETETEVETGQSVKE